RADAYVRRDHVLRRLDDADEHEGVGLLELVDGRLDELVTVNDHRHALPALDRPAGDLREEHRLAGAGRQGHGRVPRRVVGPVLLNRLDTLELIWPELHFPLLTKNRATTLIVAYSHALALFMAGPFGIGSVWWISLYSSKDKESSGGDGLQRLEDVRAEAVEVLALAGGVGVLDDRGAGVAELGDASLGADILPDVDLPEVVPVRGQFAFEPNAGSTTGLGVEDDVVHFFSFFCSFLALRLAIFARRRLRDSAVMRSPPGRSPTGACPGRCRSPADSPAGRACAGSDRDTTASPRR